MLAPNRRVFALVFSSALVWAGCGSDGEDDTGSTADAGTGGGGSDAGGSAAKETELNLTLVAITADDDSNPILTPHDVELYDAKTGEKLDPPVTGKTATSGKLKLTVPADDAFSLYVKGVGDPAVADSTYDTMVLNFPVNGGDKLLRISGAGTKASAEGTAQFTASQDRAALSGAIYWAPGGVRKGSIGCAQIYIDGQTEADVDQAQRYQATSPLPVPLEKQSETSRRGQFYFGNLKTGNHTIKVSLDDGKTFIHEESFFAPFTRDEAQSETKAILYQLGLYVDLPANPTPADCPQL
jgi:hypothetical protein